MKNWMLLMGLAGLVGGCATRPADPGYAYGQPAPFTAGAPAPDATVITGTDSSVPVAVYVPQRDVYPQDPQNEPYVWGYESTVEKRGLVAPKSWFPWGGPSWTGTFMPDYLQGRAFPWF